MRDDASFEGKETGCSYCGRKNWSFWYLLSKRVLDSRSSGHVHKTHENKMINGNFTERRFQLCRMCSEKAAGGEKKLKRKIAKQFTFHIALQRPVKSSKNTTVYSTKSFKVRTCHFS